MQQQMFQTRHRRQPRGLAVIAIIITLVVLNLIVVAIVVESARDHSLTVRRLETVQAMYAAEAGVNMSTREMIEGVDEDGDGKIGAISDDIDPATDPSLGPARFVVTLASNSPVAGQYTLTSEGRSGAARRSVESITE